MKKTLTRVIAVSALAAAVTAGVALPASAATATPTSSAAQANGDVTVVGDPGSAGGTSGLGGFDPIGIPVLGLVQAVLQAPGRLLPSSL